MIASLCEHKIIPFSPCFRIEGVNLQNTLSWYLYFGYRYLARLLTHSRQHTLTAETQLMLVAADQWKCVLKTAATLPADKPTT